MNTANVINIVKTLIDKSAQKLGLIDKIYESAFYYIYEVTFITNLKKEPHLNPGTSSIWVPSGNCQASCGVGKP